MNRRSHLIDQVSPYSHYSTFSLTRQNNRSIAAARSLKICYVSIFKRTRIRISTRLVRSDETTICSAEAVTV